MSEATVEQRKPEGRGASIVELLRQDLDAKAFVLTLDRGLETVALWLRSAAYHLKKEISPKCDALAEIGEDLELRARLGEERYGERLRAHNGRDARVDLYQEVLDAMMYARQLEEERR